jgi:acetyl-CoA carboxylase alpha subunit
LKALGVVDAVLPEPPGGAHTDPAAVCRRVGDAVEAALADLEGLSPRELIGRRYARFRALGVVQEG